MVCILSIGMLCLSSWQIIFVNIFLAVCNLVRGNASEKAFIGELGPVCFLVICDCSPVMFIFMFCVAGGDNWLLC